MQILAHASFVRSNCVGIYCTCRGICAEDPCVLSCEMWTRISNTRQTRGRTSKICPQTVIDSLFAHLTFATSKTPDGTQQKAR